MWSIRLRLLAQKAYEKSVAKDLPSFSDQLRVEHILIATVPLGGGAAPAQPKPLTTDEAKAKIDGILADIKAGKTTFEEAAKKSSDDKGSGTNGGDIGWFGKSANMDPDFQKAASALNKVGDISAPVKSQFGWHLIKLTGKPSTATAVEKAEWKKSQVARMSQGGNGISGWVNSLSTNANITTNPQIKLLQK